jgi:hypothetical protein
VQKSFNAFPTDNFAMHVPIKEMGRAVDPAAFFADWTYNPSFLIIITIVFSLLLVAELPLFSLKFKHFKWKGNEIRFVFLLLSVVMLFLLKFRRHTFNNNTIHITLSSFKHHQ